ncbi:MAG: acylphosphatase [Candidatus Micrarchaeota archaeon]
MRARVNVKIFGLVQGVFFRAHTKDKARELGLAGWVRNSPDGSVECVAEGERGALEKFLAWCRTGPPSSRVERVEEQWLEFRGEFSSFDVRY